MEGNLVGRNHNVAFTKTKGDNMIGIYKITNKMNGKCYIGQSIDVEKRLREHKLRAFRGDEKTNKEYNKALYKALRKYGIEAFTYDILLECKKEQLDELEAKYILLFQSNNHRYGYNETSGYDQVIHGLQGEKHPNHKLTTQDIYFIRECYKQHFEKDKVYEMYKERINKTGFHKIWNNQTWKDIHQDVYTEENRQYYLYKRNSHPGSKNPRALLNETDVYNIRLRRKNGEGMKEVYQDYKHTGITEGSFKNTWYYRNWKNIVV